MFGTIFLSIVKSGPRVDLFQTRHFWSTNLQMWPFCLKNQQIQHFVKIILNLFSHFFCYTSFAPFPHLVKSQKSSTVWIECHLQSLKYHNNCSFRFTHLLFCCNRSFLTAEIDIGKAWVERNLCWGSSAAEKLSWLPDLLHGESRKLILYSLNEPC